MTDTGHNSGAVASSMIRSTIERVENLDAEIAELNAGKSDVFSEAKGNGLNVKVLKKIIARRRMDPAARQEEDALMELYIRSLGAAE